jgi:single-stranded-DNA-specific exonuclease
MARWRQKRWETFPEDSETRQAIAAMQPALGCSPLVARLLVNRGIRTREAADAFLYPDFSHLPDPFQLPDAEAAAERIKQAINNREKIFVHGDYDGDGVTSAALWYRLLDRLGADVMVHVPHRRNDGYDMRSKFVQEAKAAGVKLIVTTDCGIQRCDEVEEAREAGIDVIITDHHEPGADLPKAVAVVNPHRKDSTYPFPDLAGVGVAFRMGEALVRHLGHSVDAYRRAYCDLVAIGTVTDIMPIVGENRVFVKYGLESIRCTKKPGLKALIENSGLTNQPLNAYSIGFRLGPRLNAIGRLDDSRLALDLLLTRDPVEAEALAAKLEVANRERQQEQQRILTEALEQLSGKDLTDTYCVVLCGESWHSGVIGIVASKIVERTGRPTILIAMNEETGQGRGSARSIRPFNMLEAITACGEHLQEFGGHSHAAGMGIRKETFEAFAEAMNRQAVERLSEEDFLPILMADAEIEATDVTYDFMRELALFEPFGRGNEEPLFISRSVKISDTLQMGAEKQHLKLKVQTGAAQPTDAILWNAGDMADHLHAGDKVDIAYKPRFNHFNGRTTIQLMLEDLRPSGAEDW